MAEGSRVQLIRRVYEAFNRRDFGFIRERARPDFEWRPNPDDLEQRILHGLDEAEAQFNQLTMFLADLHSDIEAIEEHGDRVIVSMHHRAHGLESGVEIERHEVHVWTFDGDRVASLAEFPDLKSARASGPAQTS
jgi:ketosteroid isomerase-like protein